MRLVYLCWSNGARQQDYQNPHRLSWLDDLALTILVKPVYDYW